MNQVTDNISHCALVQFCPNLFGGLRMVSSNSCLVASDFVYESGFRVYLNSKLKVEEKLILLSPEFSRF